MISSIFSKASSMFLLCVRCFVLFTTRQSSLLILFFSNIRSRAATHLGRNPDATAPLRDKRMSTFVFTLFTFCPPAPPEREKDISTSLFSSGRGGELSSSSPGFGKSSSLEMPIDDDEEEEENARTPSGGEEFGEVKLLPRFGGLFLLFFVPGVGFFGPKTIPPSSSSKSSELSFHGSSNSSNSS